MARNQGNKAPTQSAGTRELNLERVFDAPRDMVFRMWAEGEHMNKWSCPEGFTIPDSGGDFRPGGGWHAHMRGSDGSDHRLQGVYREIVPDERLVFTHAWLDDKGEPGPETVVTVTFADEDEDEDGKTRMKFHQGIFSSPQSRDGHFGGWTESFDKLADYLKELD